MVESQGIGKNGISDVKALGISIKKAITKLEVKISRGINSVFVSIQPEYAKLIDTEGSVILKGESVTAKDIDKAIDAAQLIELDSDEEIVDIIIPKYYVDETSFRTPLGVKGKCLEIKSQLVTAKKDYVESLYDAVAYAKLSIAGTGLGTEATASFLATKDDRIDGVFLVDTGANYTRVSLYKNDKIVDVDYIKLGGRNITKDISIVMKTSLLEAEEIKKGFSLDELTLDEDEHRYVEEIIKARILEIMNFVRKFCDRHAEDEKIRKVIIYGGGLCGFRNINKLYKNMLNRPTSFITSDIIRDDSVFSIQSGGLAYHIMNTIHFKAVVDEIVKSDNMYLNQTQSTPFSDDEFLRKFQKDHLLGENGNSFEDEDGEYLDEEIGITEKLSGWFSKVKNKFSNK